MNTLRKITNIILTRNQINGISHQNKNISIANANPKAKYQKTHTKANQCLLKTTLTSSHG